MFDADGCGSSLANSPAVGTMDRTGKEIENAKTRTGGNALGEVDGQALRPRRGPSVAPVSRIRLLAHRVQRFCALPAFAFSIPVLTCPNPGSPPTSQDRGTMIQ